MYTGLILVLLFLAGDCGAVFHPFFDFNGREDWGETVLEPVVGRRAAGAGWGFAGVTSENVTLPLDHFGNHPGTFQNRYWVLDEFYQPGSPVFLYDAGEGNAETGVQGRLGSNSSFFRQLVRDFTGVGIVWEHRYYGRSTHVNISKDTPVEEFRWLTTAQALADVPAFANNFSLASFPDSDLTPAATPWVVVGGSYPGMRAAFLRLKYPNTIFAALSSSAPVQARVNMSSYYDQIYAGLSALGFANCTKDLVAAVGYVDEQLDKGGSDAAAIKRWYFGARAEGNSNGGFADALTQIYYGWQGSRVDGTPASLRSLCNWMSTNPDTGELSGEDGWAVTKGAKYASDRFATWPKLGSLVNYYTPTNCAGHYGNSTRRAADCRFDDPYPQAAAISWTYQYCSEWGFFQAANTGPHALVSSYNSIAHQQEICNRQFPRGLSTGLLPPSPAVDKMNAEYSGWNIRPSNVFFTAGEFDPWRTLSVMADGLGVEVTLEIPDEGAVLPREKLFGYLLKGAAHCFDFKSEWPDAAVPRRVFADALRKWLAKGYHKVA